MAVALKVRRPSRREARPWALVITLAFGLGLGLGLLPSGRTARACSCATPPPPSQALSEAAAVFDGTVTRIEAATIGVPFQNLTVSFVVHTQWKGISAGTVQVTTADNGAMCGYHFLLGRRYIVYATGSPGRLEVNLCGRTRGHDTAEAEALGPDSPPPGAVPAAAWPYDPPTVGCPRCAMPPPPRQALDEAAAVFHGRLVAVSYLGAESNYDHVATFRNLGWWKGPDSATIDVRVPWNVWSCEQQVGRVGGVTDWGEYLVYARGGDGGALELALCGRTKAYDAEEAAELGSPNPPGPAQPTGSAEPGTTETPAVTETPTPEASASATPAACPTLECPGCPGPRPAREWLDECDLAFYGRVLAIEPMDCDHRVTFHVLESWKGPLIAELVVDVDMLSWQCTRSFTVGQEAFVFAVSGVRSLYIPNCFGIVDGDPRDVLGPGTPVPTNTTTPTPTASPTTPFPLTCTPPPCPCGRLVGECPNVRCEVCTETPTASPSTTPTPFPLTCTPPPCPCGRLVGECPNVRCEVCTETPGPGDRVDLFLPWVVRSP